MRTARWLTIVGALLGALVCYMTGFALGLATFLAAGAVLELTFWIAALSGGPSRGDRPRSPRARARNSSS